MQGSGSIGGLIERSAALDQTRRFGEVSSMSVFHLIAPMADRGRRSGASFGRAPKGNARGIAPGAIPILEFRNSYPRRRIPSTQKRQRPHFFWQSSCMCGHARNPAHSLRLVISTSHPKRPDQRVEREAQIAEIADRPQRRVLVDADDATRASISPPLGRWIYSPAYEPCLTYAPGKQDAALIDIRSALAFEACAPTTTTMYPVAKPRNLLEKS
jgi:hypothetical protein